MPAETNEDDLAELMVGREVPLTVDRGDVASRPTPCSTVEGLHVKDDRGHEVVKGVDLEVRAGEILGIAGVAGNGQDELVEAIIGLRRPSAGKVTLDGKDITGQPPRDGLRTRASPTSPRTAIGSAWCCRSRSPTTSS